MLRAQYEDACKKVARISRVIRKAEKFGLNCEHERKELAKAEQAMAWARESGHGF